MEVEQEIVELRRRRGNRQAEDVRQTSLQQEEEPVGLRWGIRKRRCNYDIQTMKDILSKRTLSSVVRQFLDSENKCIIREINKISSGIQLPRSYILKQRIIWQRLKE